jgi:aminoglycoside phosphotransferase (APT) family kinase protein
VGFRALTRTSTILCDGIIAAAGAVSGGQLSAVIDFAGLGAGDPACDLVIAWNLFSPETRPVFRAALQVDDATWTRAQGWALITGLNAYTSYAATNPLVALNTHRQISHVLIDRARTT